MGTLSHPKRVMSKAVKFTSKDQSREVLTCVHLDERGEVVACDSYRLFAATVWSGPSINVPADLAKKMAKIPAKYDEVEVVQAGDVIECRYGGNVLKGDAVEGEYPKYRQLFNGWEAEAVSEVPAKQAAVICRAHKREGVFVEVGNGSTVVWGAGCDTEPSAMFRTGCQGEGRVKLNAEYLESALKACGERACIEVMNERKPVFVKWGEVSVMLMPIMAGSFTEPLIKKLHKRREQDMAKKEERMEGVKLQGAHVCITGTLPMMTRGEAFTRLKLVGGVPCERFNKKVTLFVIAAKAGRDKRKKAEAAIANGQQVRIIDGHEFTEALKAAEKAQEDRAKELAKRKAKAPELTCEHFGSVVDGKKVHCEKHGVWTNCLEVGRCTLADRKAPEKPKAEAKEHGGWVVYGETGPCLVAWVSYSTLKTNKGACEWLKRTAREVDGTELATVHAEFVGSTAERDERTDKVKAKLKAYYDKVVTWTPTSGKSGFTSTWERAPKGDVKQEEKEDAQMKKQIEELEAKLKAMSAELEQVWKENATLKAAKPKEVPPAPKAPKPEKVEATAAAVSLSFMDMDAEGAERCMEVIREAVRPGIEDGTVSVRWKGKTLAPIRVEGATKPFQDELDGLGLRWAGKSKYWYLSPTMPKTA